jgi:type IV pilus assembly protein PilB
MSKTVENKKPLKGRKKLGECLVEAGLIDQKTLARALDIQKMQKKKIGQILMDMGVIDDQEIAKALSTQLKIPLVRLKGLEIPKEIISIVPSEMAENYLIIPIKKQREVSWWPWSIR